MSNDQLLEHVAEHIHSFALRSLPWAPDKNEDDRATIEHSFEKVEGWFAKCHPGAETFGYKLNSLAIGCQKDPAIYFHTHEYFAESSRASSLALTLSSTRSNNDEDDDKDDESHVAAPGKFSLASALTSTNRALYIYRTSRDSTTALMLRAVSPQSEFCRPWNTARTDQRTMLCASIASSTGGHWWSGVSAAGGDQVDAPI